MNRKLVSLIGLAGLAALGAVVAALTLRGGNSETVSAAPAAADVPYLSYAVKFVCGEQKPIDPSQFEPPVKPGNYATEINIHNPNYTSVTPNSTSTLVHKKLVVLVGGGRNNIPFAFREPKLAKPGRFVRLEFPPDTATMDTARRSGGWRRRPACPPCRARSPSATS